MVYYLNLQYLKLKLISFLVDNQMMGKGNRKYIHPKKDHNHRVINHDTYKNLKHNNSPDMGIAYKLICIGQCTKIHMFGHLCSPKYIVPTQHFFPFYKLQDYPDFEVKDVCRRHISDLSNHCSHLDN